MELRCLRTFREVAVLSSFSRAGEALYLAQSTVSAHIKALEDELGVPLFDRLGRQIALTDAGELLFNQAQRLIAIEEETLAEITGHSEPKGSLVIRVPQTISTCLFPRILGEFQKRFPKVRIEFIGCTFSVEHELRTGMIDLAFLLIEAFYSDNLNVEHMGEENLVLVAHASHPLAGRDDVKLQDLTGQTLLLSKTDCSYRKAFERSLAEKKIEPETILEFNAVEAIKESVAAGAGITLIPKIAVRNEIASKRLAVLKGAEMVRQTQVFMIWHKNKWISPALKAFMDAVRLLVGSQEHGGG